MRAAAEALDEFAVPYEADVVSAHRMPHEVGGHATPACSRSASSAPPTAPTARRSGPG
jgi:phosphoribosylcarboxyaminoimidazole (NCAIR) mutase